MYEVQLQGLLERTKPSQGDEEAMDMTTINGIRISKYSIQARKAGEKVSAQMREEFEQFNFEHIEEDSVFSTKNGAPKILEQFKDKPYTLELRASSPRVLNPNHCLRLRRCIIMANQPRVKC